MSTFILLNGNTVVTERFMQGPALPKNHSWRNNAPLGEKPVWAEVAYPVESVDPNLETLFGYETQTFLAKQYR